MAQSELLSLFSHVQGCVQTLNFFFFTFPPIRIENPLAYAAGHVYQHGGAHSLYLLHGLNTNLSYNISKNLHFLSMRLHCTVKSVKNFAFAAFISDSHSSERRDFHTADSFTF